MKETRYKDRWGVRVPKFCEVCGSPIKRARKAIREAYDGESGERYTVYQVWHACSSPYEFLEDWRKLGHYSQWDYYREQRG